MSRNSKIGERDWSKQPLFTARRRRYGHWLFLMLVLVVTAAVVLLFPDVASALLLPLIN